MNLLSSCYPVIRFLGAIFEIGVLWHAQDNAYLQPILTVIKHLTLKDLGKQS